MKYLCSALIIILLSGCIHTITDDEIKSSYNMPENFRNALYIKDLNDNKTI